MNTLDIIWKTITPIAVILGVVVSLFFIDDYLDNQIEDKINDIEYIQKISHTLRPYVIFDQDGIVSYDHGVMQFTTQIKTIFHPFIPYHGIVKAIPQDTIYITLNKYFQNPPILESIGPVDYFCETTQVTNFTWLFELQTISPIPGSPKGIFRLELLK